MRLRSFSPPKEEVGRQPHRYRQRLREPQQQPRHRAISVSLPTTGSPRLTAEPRAGQRSRQTCQRSAASPHAQVAGIRPVNVAVASTARAWLQKQVANSSSPSPLRSSSADVPRSLRRPAAPGRNPELETSEVDSEAEAHAVAEGINRSPRDSPPGPFGLARQPMTRSWAGLVGTPVPPGRASAVAVASSAGSQVMSR